ncbi:MAG TPA: helix-turn-helix domain-containing protein [Terracidiphilus sp.]|nr:helix-turn-helix domain-containing protein [Terracidiphilus sp.]
MTKTVRQARWPLELYCIGKKLRALRMRKGLTLARLAGETGLSTALLSKLETDRMIPTLPTLGLICGVYGVGLSHFFSEPSRHSLSITRKAHLTGKTRAPEEPRVTPLQGAPEEARLVVQMLELAAGGAPFSPGGSTQTGCFVYVLEGQLEMDTGGVREILEAGDCASLETEMVTSWTAAGSHLCRALLVTPGT